MLNRRQVDVQHQNLASMCRIAVKSLLDYACLNTHVDEDCEEFINFCAVFENVVSHRLRPHQKRVWHRGEGSPRHFWDVLLENHNLTPDVLFITCIPNIERIENIKLPKAKLRAFLRVALMEKRLSEYMFWLLDSKGLMRQCYLDGALLTCDEGAVLCGDLIGLNAIDFNFCLKGKENELLGPLEINYAPFLCHKQSLASQNVDEEEMLRLSGKLNDKTNATKFLGDNSETRKLLNLERDYRSIKEQKEYLEELLRLRERQLSESKMRVETMRVNQSRIERDWNQERKVLDACVLELQGEMSGLQIQNDHLRQQVANLQQFKDRLDVNEVPMMDMADRPEKPIPYLSSADPRIQSEQSVSATGACCDRKSNLSDQTSFQSLTSDQMNLKEDSHSMIPMAGSFIDVNMAMLKDQTNGNDERKETKQAVHSNQEGTESEGDAIVPTVNEATEEEEKSMHHPNFGLKKEPEELMSISGITESYIMPEIIGNIESSPSAPDSNTGTDSNDAIVIEVITEKSLKTSTHLDDECGSNIQEVEIQKETTNPHDASGYAPSSLQIGAEDEAEIERTAEVMTISDASGVSSGPELKEEYVLTSDPEILDRTNTSSDGSEAAWEMLSDSEQAEQDKLN